MLGIFDRSPLYFFETVRLTDPSGWPVRPGLHLSSTGTEACTATPDSLLMQRLGEGGSNASPHVCVASTSSTATSSAASDTIFILGTGVRMNMAPVAIQWLLGHLLKSNAVNQTAIRVQLWPPFCPKWPPSPSGCHSIDLMTTTFM